MELAFATKGLRQISENEIVAKRELGQEPAARLKRRLADIRAAESICDLLVAPGNDFTLDGLHISVALSKGYRLVLSANHNVNPKTGSGSVDWHKVSRVKVEKIFEPSKNDA